jgi:hypothetical protein
MAPTDHINTAAKSHTTATSTPYLIVSRLRRDKLTRCDRLLPAQSAGIARGTRRGLRPPNTRQLQHHQSCVNEAGDTAHLRRESLRSAAAQLRCTPTQPSEDREQGAHNRCLQGIGQRDTTVVSALTDRHLRDGQPPSTSAPKHPPCGRKQGHTDNPKDGPPLTTTDPLRVAGIRRTPTKRNIATRRRPAPTGLCNPTKPSENSSRGTHSRCTRRIGSRTPLRWRP